jgi:hypothetical protein
VVNSGDAKKEQLKLAWADGTNAPLETYVPPGQSRILQLPPAGANQGELRLIGDDEDFDNRLYWVGTRQAHVNVAYLGTEADKDTAQPRCADHSAGGFEYAVGDFERLDGDASPYRWDRAGGAEIVRLCRGDFRTAEPRAPFLRRGFRAKIFVIGGHRFYASSVQAVSATLRRYISGSTDAWTCSKFRMRACWRASMTGTPR